MNANVDAGNSTTLPFNSQSRAPSLNLRHN